MKVEFFGVFVFTIYVPMWWFILTATMTIETRSPDLINDLLPFSCE
jgi:hypothetical protein